MFSVSIAGAEAARVLNHEITLVTLNENLLDPDLSGEVARVMQICNAAIASICAVFRPWKSVGPSPSMMSVIWLICAIIVVPVTMLNMRRCMN